MPRGRHQAQGAGGSRQRPYPSGRRGRGRRLVFDEGFLESRSDMLARRETNIQQQLRQLSEPERFDLLASIFIRFPSITWQFLGRPGDGQPADPPVAPPVAWCHCGKCREMPTQAERVCCGTTPCITFDPECALATTDRFCLNIGRTYHNDRWAEPAPDPEDLDGVNRQFRYQAYRHFVIWRFGYLGRGARRVIPSCVVWVIRDEFPNPNGIYVGFREVPL